MSKLIFDNYEMLNTKDARELAIEELQRINEDQGMPDYEITEEDIDDYLNEDYAFCFDAEVDNLDLSLDGRVLVIADLGLWNGHRIGYKIGKANLNEIMNLGNEDMFKVYAEHGNIKKISYHHDGTNHLLFREIREERDIEILLNKMYDGETITNKMLNYYTKSLYPYVKEIYGW